MKPLMLIYIINASLLLLHEIESAYIKEWEILKLPGKITGFLLMHIPIIMVLFLGAIEIGKQTMPGAIITMIAGVGGLIPFIVHKIIVKKKGYFDSKISNCIIYLNALTGITTLVVAASYF
ncbi:MAG: hypothetical protein M1372_02995 [Patescibacteria group bacterium]|nr:hypothetical protein [Patescibacteria group bacterium]